VNNYVEKQGLDTPTAAKDAAFNNLPIGKASRLAPEIKGLRAHAARKDRARQKIIFGNICV
jgi:hypothetical protein